MELATWMEPLTRNRLPYHRGRLPRRWPMDGSPVGRLWQVCNTDFGLSVSSVRFAIMYFKYLELFKNLFFCTIDPLWGEFSLSKIVMKLTAKKAPKTENWLEI